MDFSEAIAHEEKLEREDPPLKMNKRRGPALLLGMEKQKQIVPSEHPVWTCRRSHCEGTLILLGAIDHYKDNIEEARQRAMVAKACYPATFTHGAALSCTVCGDRPLMMCRKRKRRAAWQRLCVVCCEPYAMNGFWRAHGGYNKKMMKTDLRMRAHVHKHNLCTRFKTMKDVEILDECLDSEKKWLALAVQGKISKTKHTVDDEILSTFEFNANNFDECVNVPPTPSTNEDVKVPVLTPRALDSAAHITAQSILMRPSEAVPRMTEHVGRDEFNALQKPTQRKRAHPNQILSPELPTHQNKVPRYNEDSVDALLSSQQMLMPTFQHPTNAPIMQQRDSFTAMQNAQREHLMNTYSLNDLYSADVDVLDNALSRQYRGVSNASNASNASIMSSLSNAFSVRSTDATFFRGSASSHSSSRSTGEFSVCSRNSV